MVEYVTGIVKQLDEGLLILEVGFIGFTIQVPITMNAIQSKELQLYIHLHWNQETGPSLYGFSTQREKRIFLLVTDCPGVGPRIGMAVLSELGVDRFLEAIQAGDIKALSSVNGIGAKKAEQMVLSLKHKVAQLIKSGFEVSAATTIQWQEVMQVLESLHYTKTEVAQALQYVQAQSKESNMPFDGLIRTALSFLAKKR